jgi:phosphate acyltransferase
MVCVAVDAMGGDGGPETVVPAVGIALQADPDLQVALTGPRSIDTQLAGLPAALRRRVNRVVADSVLPSDASAAQAIRHGQGSSMWQAMGCLADRDADAVVSGGSTAALMALSRHRLGMLPGVERPALMAAIPTTTNLVWMLDLGANVNVDARRLLEFAQLGHVGFSVLEGRQPRIGLLNIGSEPGKGPDVVREAARLIEAESTLNFIGFVEADQVFEARVDLVVCDGFAGNVLLKGAEGAVRLMFAAFRRTLKGSLCGLLARSRMQALHDMLDPARHNGAPLLGIRGTVIKSHGRSCAGGVARAIELAALQARNDLVGKLESKLWESY